MLLTITTTHQPATDLGYLLVKNPARVQEFELSFGKAVVFYPEASEECCTAALLLEVDPVGLVRGRQGPAGEGRQLEQYVNDRPYVASSFMSVALAAVFRTALSGKSKERPELAEAAIPLEATLTALPCRGGEGFLRRLFEPLGYRLDLQRLPLDSQHPEWGSSPYFTVTLAAECRLCDLLTHLYVLVPVLDQDKHYWVGEDEVEKLLRFGEGWLNAHPEKKEITRRYLQRRPSLIRQALARLAAEDTGADEEETSNPDRLEAQMETQIDASASAPGATGEDKPRSLNDQRLEAVLAALRESGARRVLDLGCGEGRLLERLMRQNCFQEIVGLDVSYRAMEIAQRRLHLDRASDRQRERVRLLHGALTYRDRRLEGFDAAAVVEVIEHLDLPRLAAFERVLFECARPGVVVLSTPNAEYNVRWPSLPAGRFRHRDHRFEWSRSEFQTWAEAVAGRFGYTVQFSPIGPIDPEVGSPTQMAVFTRST